MQRVNAQLSPAATRPRPRSAPSWLPRGLRTRCGGVRPACASRRIGPCVHVAFYPRPETFSAPELIGQHVRSIPSVPGGRPRPQLGVTLDLLEELWQRENGVTVSDAFCDPYRVSVRASVTVNSGDAFLSQEKDGVADRVCCRPLDVSLLSLSGRRKPSRLLRPIQHPSVPS